MHLCEFNPSPVLVWNDGDVHAGFTTVVTVAKAYFFGYDNRPKDLIVNRSRNADSPAEN